MGLDDDPVPPGSGNGPQGQTEIEKFGKGVRPDNAALPEHTVVDLVGSRQGPGVR